MVNASGIFSLDLFSMPFNFRFVGKEKGRKTTMGTVCSVVVIILSLFYLVYLFYQFFTHQFTPKVVVQSNTISELEYQFEVSPIMFKFYTAGQKIEFKEYFDYEAYFSEGDDTTKKNKRIDITECENIDDQFGDQDSLEKYACIKPFEDDAKANSNMVLFVDNTGKSNYIQVQQKACVNDPDGSGGQQGGKHNCKSIGTIQDLMASPFFKVELLLVYYEFDITNSGLTQRRKKIVLPGDYNNVGSYTMYVEISKISEDKGWLFSQFTDYLYVSGYDVDLQVLDPEFQRRKLDGFSIDKYFSYFKFELQLKQTETIIEYPKISEVFAQYSAMFNVLLYLGILAKLNSEAQIYQEMGDVMLKEYFKTSAEQVVNEEVKEELEKRRTDKEGRKLKHSPTTMEVMKKVKRDREKEFSTMARVYLPRGKSKNNKISDPQAVDKTQIYHSVLDKAISDMNASHLFKEVYRMKTAIQILFTPKQYAALSYVGRSIPDDYIMRDNRNHLEENDYIEENVILREKYLKEFLEDMKANKTENNNSDVIYNCLLESVQKGEYHNAFFQNKGGRLHGERTLENSQVSDRQKNVDKDQDQVDKLQDLDQEKIPQRESQVIIEDNHQTAMERGKTEEQQDVENPEEQTLNKV